MFQYLHRCAVMDANETFLAPEDGGDYEFTEDRNIVVVGRTGVGKSMLINQIVGKPLMKVGFSIGHMTKEILRAFGDMQYQNKKYNVTFIDTVGLGDDNKRSSSTDEERTHIKDEKIIEDVKSAMQDKKDIHLIIFVFSMDMQAENTGKLLRTLNKYFNELLYTISAAVITHCEDFNANMREKVVQNLAADDKTKEFFSLMKKGIYTVGFPDTKTLKKHRVTDDLLIDIKKDADQMRSLISKCNNPITTVLSLRRGSSGCVLT